MGVYFQRTRDARKAEAEASKDASEDEGGRNIGVIWVTWQGYRSYLGHMAGI